MQTLPAASPAKVQQPARLGQINFINSLPVVLPLLRSEKPEQANIVLATPAELNRDYALGKLDLGAMSSFFFLQSRKMQLIRGLSISSIGPVGSVLFFSKKELHKLHDSTIAVPMSSSTSINLLSVMLREQFGVEPRLVNNAQPEIQDSEIDGALVIGDRALLVDQEWSKKFLRIDMGEWWYCTYRLPMTFGVWAADKDWALGNKELFQRLSRSLVDAARDGLSVMFDEVIAQSMERLPLSKERLESYFRHELNFDFGHDHESGLNLYRHLCKKYDLLQASDANALVSG